MDHPFWLSAIENKEINSFVYLQRVITEGRDHTYKVYAEVHGGTSNSTLYVLGGGIEKATAMTLCRTTPVGKSHNDEVTDTADDTKEKTMRNAENTTDTIGEVKHLTLGIQTLNMMLDPNKSSERAKTANDATEKYHSNFGQLDISQSYGNLFHLLWYSKLPCFDVKDVTSKEKDEMSVIKRCIWKGEDINCASVFVTRPTDRGMCCSFNGEAAEKVFKSTTYGNTTSKLQREDKGRSFGTTVLPKWYNSLISYSQIVFGIKNIHFSRLLHLYLFIDYFIFPINL